MGKNKILLIGFFASLAFLIPFMFQDAFAQSSATVQLFQTSNANDDSCNTITQTDSVAWLGCYSDSATSTLRINAMTGNSTIATATLAGQSNTHVTFFPVTSNTIVLVDTSGASEVVRKYQLSGSTITNTASLTLTGCSAESYRPNVVGTTLFYQCADGTIKVVNMNTMILEDTYSTLIQGNCANPQSIFMTTGVKGVVFCDNTEANLFTVSGSIITFTDELTGWTSITSNRGILITGTEGIERTVWTWNHGIGSSIEVATIDFQAMTWSTGITTVPSQADAVTALPIFGFIFTADETDDNILAYAVNEEQPSVAKANFSGGGLLVSPSSQLAVASSGVDLLLSASVTDTGRYYIISEIIIDGEPVDTEPTENDPFNTGIDCSLPANEHKLICNIPGGGGITTNLGNATGRELLLLSCTVVFVTCEDTNPQTNGMGLLAFIASLFVIVGMFYYVLGTDRVATIPLFVWIIIVIALSAFFTLAGWIDPVFLIISIVAVIALAAPRLISVIRGGGGNTMGGGSTE